MTNRVRPSGARPEGVRRCGLRAGAAAVLLALPASFFAASTAAAASAQPFACTDLAAIIDSAEAEFAPIRGPLRSSIMPGANPLRRAPEQGSPASAGRNETDREFEKRVLSTKFEVHIYATTRPLAGAASCEIRLVNKEDARSALQEASYRCDWPATDGFAVLRQAVASCVPGVTMREETPESLRLYLERIPSDEGERSVVVSVEHAAMQGARLSVSRHRAWKRSP